MLELASRPPLSDLRDHVGLVKQQKCVEDQFSWFKSLGGQEGKSLKDMLVIAKI